MVYVDVCLQKFHMCGKGMLCDQVGTTLLPVLYFLKIYIQAWVSTHDVVRELGCICSQTQREDWIMAQQGSCRSFHIIKAPGLCCK